LEHLTTYARILQSAYPGGTPPDGLSEDERLELLCKGVIVTLEADGGEPAVELLYASAAAHPFPTVQRQAQTSLERLAQQGSAPAINALYRLAVETARLAVAQTLQAHRWQPTRPPLRALFDFFYAAPPADAAGLEQLTQGFFEEASPALRERLLTASAAQGLENWALIVAAESQISAGAEAGEMLEALLARYPALREPERRLALNRLARLAESGPEAARAGAQEAIARLFVDHDDPRARQIALERGYLPQDPEKRALFLFLAEAWPQYEALDFNHALLVGLYEYGSKTLRRRLLEHARRTGYLEWLRGTEAAAEVRWSADLTDADWDLALRRLSEQGRWEELWQLAQAAPPLWSAAMINRLADQGWLPPDAADHDEFAALSRLACACLAAPLAIRPRRQATAPAPLTALALRPDDAQLAAGSAAQAIFRWNLPGLTPAAPELTGPAPVTRALAYSPDGSLLAAAGGDHRIRIFRLSDGSLVKTLEGHRALIRALAIHPEGRLLASAGFDGSIRLWRFPFGPEIKLLRPAPENPEIFSLAISAGESRLLTAGAEGVIRVWSLPDGALLRTLTGHSDTITHLASGAGDLIVSTGRDQTVRVWNIHSGRQVQVMAHPGGPLTALCLHPSEQIIIGAAAGPSQNAPAEILIWNLSTGRLVDRLAGHRQTVTALALSRSGETLYSADSAGRLFIWDLRAFLAIRLTAEEWAKSPAAQGGGLAPEALELSEDPGLSAPERQWLTFAHHLHRFRQRFDIEVAEVTKIPLGEFDIEL